MKKIPWLLFLSFLPFIWMSCSEKQSKPEERNAKKHSRVDSIPQSNPCMGINPAHLAGQFNPADDSEFQVISERFTPKARIFLRIEALAAFEAMWSAARKDGIELVILSATRNWTYQRGIWNRKWSGPRYSEFEGKARAIEILKYSAMPGSSRHHWGTDIDLNAFENEWFENDTVGKAVYAWLKANAPQYGYHQVYGDASNGRPGYREEKWHWSYLQLADPLLACYLSHPPNGAFEGFEGAQWSDSIGIVESYVNGIDRP